MKNIQNNEFKHDMGIRPSASHTMQNGISNADPVNLRLYNISLKSIKYTAKIWHIKNKKVHQNLKSHLNMYMQHLFYIMFTSVYRARKTKRPTASNHVTMIIFDWLLASEGARYRKTAANEELANVS